ncbi:MAG: putative DNA binding domain-containing protein [Armatimonadetes bacterium]|nr:putative DNA binding domain-containing protein [Armatimonadota bacterium]
MQPNELQARIAKWENLHTDFKERIDSADELAKDIVCFANTDGGEVIIGVTQEGNIVGVTDADAVNRTVDSVAYNNCEPPVSVVQEVLDVGGRKAVVVSIPKGEQRPYRTNRGLYYIRTSSGCRPAARQELLRMFQDTESLFYDETPLPRLALADLDLTAFEYYLEQTGRAEVGLEADRLLRNWGLLAHGHPTIAGLLLFGREPQIHPPFAQVNAARIPGTEAANNPSDRKDLTGRLLDVIDQAQRFLYLHLPIPHHVRGFKPEPKPELPEEALREAVVNAVAHRDYTVHGPVRLFIFDDRIEIHTPGRPPNTVSEEAMRAGVHVVRNPRIYARLSDAGLVTRAGTGIRRIIKLVREATGQDIQISIRDFETSLTLPRRAVTCTT